MIGEGMPQPGDLVRNIERVIAGKSEAVRLVVVGLLAEGHVLIEDLPGTGKTTLAQALARSIDASFRRIQCTSDMLPADLLGVSVLDPASGTFRFQKGPIFGHVVVADELNRATPRTQSALLEAMNEAQVSIDGTTYPLPSPFVVVATQNPIEVEGTYPLPESQLDRFLVRVALGYPSKDVEREILARHQQAPPLAALGAVATVADVATWQAHVRSIRIEAPLIEYLLAIVEASREEKGVRPRREHARGARAASRRAGRRVPGRSRLLRAGRRQATGRAGARASRADARDGRNADRRQYRAAERDPGQGPRSALNRSSRFCYAARPSEKRAGEEDRRGDSMERVGESIRRSLRGSQPAAAMTES
jgi:MoxR-like ATPase